MQIFDERISCTKHDDFLPRSHQAVSLQVAPFPRDCKGRGCRRDRRAGRTERKTSKFFSPQIGILVEKNFLTLRAALPYDPFRSKEITDISIIKEYFVRIHYHLIQ